MHKAATVARLLVALVILAALGGPVSAQSGLLSGWSSKLDPLLQQRARLVFGRSRVIVRANDAAGLPLLGPIIQRVGGTLGRPLPIIDAYVADVPNSGLIPLATSPLVNHLSFDRLIVGALERTGATVGATSVRSESHYDGAGLGIAVIDSGITAWHDDLTGAGGGQRVDQFVDLVNGRQQAYDDYGHGTHVAGIVAGNGFDSNGARSGIAPAARLIVLKVLDRSGRGRISTVIAALDYVLTNRRTLNIRIANLSIATGVYESFNVDPLTLAARRTVDVGIVVVAAAGNVGRSVQGRTQYGGITAPGNAPWVLTVGGSSHMGTIDRADDTIAGFSSRGPTAIDRAAKPDIVAPAVGIESLSDPDSFLYTAYAPYLLRGTVTVPARPYLSLSGTSMSAPVVSGTVALMLQANPALTPNQVKAILQHTAEVHAAYDPMTQGAGFLNAKGAVELARFVASPSTAPAPDASLWGARLVWGDVLVQGGTIVDDVNALAAEMIWGTGSVEGIFGTSDSDMIVWGSDGDEMVVWGSTSDDIVVWGSRCEAATCEPVIWGSE